MTLTHTTAMRPLLALLEQVEHERDLALAQQQRALAQLQSAQQQADQLIVYRNDYAQRFAPQLRQASTPDMLRCYQGFMNRLQVAIDQQAHTVRQWETGIETANESVQRQELRVASVRKLIERRTREIDRHADRQEQRASDEFASRRAMDRLRGSHFASTRV